MSEIQPIIENESYANVVRRPVETVKKARVFTKDNQQNVFDDSSLDFTKNINNGNSNTYDQIPGTSGNINFSDLFKALKGDDNKVLCRAETPVESPSTDGKNNASGNDTSLDILDSGHEQLVEILQSFETKKTPKKAAKVINERLEGYFCSKSVFNLSKKVLTETEIRVLEKGLGFAPTPTKINETDLRADFNEFARKMRCKWFFRNEPTENFSEAPAFRVKSNWNPPKGHPAVEIFLSKLETEIFSVLPGTPLDYNLSKEEWLAMRGLAEDRNIIIKPADKGSCVVVWDREDYIAEADRQLKDNETYESSSLKDVDLVKLVEKSNSIFQSLRKRKLITEEELKYFTYKYKKATNFGKMYLLPKIHKRLVNVPGRPVISNCGTPTEKASEFLDHHLQPIMKSGTSYIKDTNDFLSKLKNLKKVPDNTILVTADVAELYPSIPHNEGLEVLKKQLDSFYEISIPTVDLVKMAEFVLKNNYFEFNSNVKHV